jgi:hypothetical protein
MIMMNLHGPLGPPHGPLLGVTRMIFAGCMHSKALYEANISKQHRISYLLYLSAGHLVPSIPVLPGNLGDRRAQSGEVLLYGRDQEYSQKFWEIDQNKTLFFPRKMNRRGIKFHL